MAGEPSISAVVNVAKFRRAMEDVPADLFRELKSRVRVFLQGWIKDKVQREKFDGDPLKARTGQMRRAFGVLTLGSSLDDLTWISGAVRGELPYINIHEYGKTIRPVRAKFLTVPFPAAKTPAGVLRFSAREAMDMEDVGIIKTSRGMLIVRQGKNKWEPLFALVKQVTIKPTFGFRDSFDAMLPDLGKAVDAGVVAALKQKEGRS